jgi:DNA (cytosine-5)-methyltransferase 1
MTDLTKKPCPTISQSGIGTSFHGQYHLEDDGMNVERQSDLNKPPYRIPFMMEIRAAEADTAAYALRPTVISTFAGGGGSSLGWRMAGFRVLWASEFDEHQAMAYSLNKNPGTVLDRRDIRGVSAEEVMDAAGLSPGELDVLDGSPPCQTFSTAGRRQMNDERSDLFFEYVRLLRALRPKAFVAENVSGMVKGVAKGMFKIILRELKDSGYVVSARVLDAQWLGVPQVRNRVIFVGARDDLGTKPAHPVPFQYRYSVSEACPWLLGTREGHENAGVEMQFNNGPSATVRTTDQGQKFAVPAIDTEIIPVAPSRQGMSTYGRRQINICDASPTITIASPGNDTPVPTCSGERRKFTIAELKRICSFPDDFDMGDLSYAKRWAVMGNAVPPLMMRAIAETVRNKILVAQPAPKKRLARKR